MVQDERMTGPLANWAGNLTYSTDRLIEGTSVEHVRTLVRAQEMVKALGSRHCFNDIHLYGPCSTKSPVLEV